MLMRMLLAGDVVYLRLASPITADARRALAEQLANDIPPAAKANRKASFLRGSGSRAAAVAAPSSRQRDQAQAAQQQVSVVVCREFFALATVD
jgi:hypothetical protein